MATQSSILAWRMDRRAWQATVHGVTRVGHDSVTKTHTHTHTHTLGLPTLILQHRDSVLVTLLCPQTWYSAKKQSELSYYLLDEEDGHPGPGSASLVAQLVKKLPAAQETWVRFQGWEDPLEKEISTHSSILAWKILWSEEPGGLQCMGSQE